MLNIALAPLFGNNSTKSTIVQALTEKPLSLKEIHNHIRGTSNKPITYQAVHKAVKEMLADEILEKAGKQIQINKEWVEKLSNFTANLKNSQDKPQYEAKSKATTYEFETFVDFGKFIIKFSNDTPNPRNRPGVCVMKHAWPSFGMNKNDYETVKKFLKETQFYDLTLNDTPLDRAFSNMLAQIGKNVKTGAKFNIQCDLVCKGDQIANIYFTKEFQEKFDDLFKKSKSLEELQVNDIMQEFMATKTKITVVITTDADAANNVIDEVLRVFNEK